MRHELELLRRHTAAYGQDPLNTELAYAAVEAAETAVRSFHQRRPDGWVRRNVPSVAGVIERLYSRQTASALEKITRGAVRASPGEITVTESPTEAIGEYTSLCLELLYIRERLEGAAQTLPGESFFLADLERTHNPRERVLIKQLVKSLYDTIQDGCEAAGIQLTYLLSGAEADARQKVAEASQRLAEISKIQLDLFSGKDDFVM